MANKRIDEYLPITPASTDLILVQNPTTLAYNKAPISSLPSGGGGGTSLPADATGWLHDNGSGTLAWTTPTKSDVGLGNVDNTSDVNKPVSTAQAAADATKAAISGQVFTGAISATNLSGTNTGDQTTVSGNAGTATTLATSRTIGTLTGDVTSAGSSFNGSANNTNATVVGKINGVALSGLATGILKNTTATGVPSIAVAADFPTLNQNTTGTAAGLSANITESQVTNLVSDLAAKQATLSLTTTGTTGAATLVSNTLNIPQYSAGGGGDMVLASTQTVSGAKTFNAGTLLDKGEIVFDVKAYGATGNGATDDTTAIQSAIDAANTAGGGVVHFPKGTYKISTNPLKLYSGTTPTITAYSNITIRGSGAGGVGGTIINQTTTGVDVIKALNDPANGAQSVSITIENICLAFSGTATNSGNGLYLAQQATSAPAFYQWTIRNVRVNNCQGTGKYAFNFESLIVSTLQGCHAYSCANGYYFNGSALAHYGSVSTSVSLLNCYSNAVLGYGYRLVNATYVTLVACAVDFSTNVTTAAYSMEGCNVVCLTGCGFEGDFTHTLANGFYIGNDASAVGSQQITLNTCYGFQSKTSIEVYVTGAAKGVTIIGYQSNSSVSGSTGLKADAGTNVVEMQCAWDTGVATVRTINATAKDTIIGDSDFPGVLTTPALQVTGGTIASGKVLTSDASGNATWQTVSGSGLTRSVNSISAPATAGAVASTDYVYLVSGTTTLTLPTAIGNTNLYTVKNTGVATVTIATTLSQTIDGSTTVTLTVNTSLDLVSDNANWRVV